MHGRFLLALALAAPPAAGQGGRGDQWDRTDTALARKARLRMYEFLKKRLGK
jgi:hypothetical protein